MNAQSRPFHYPSVPSLATTPAGAAMAVTIDPHTIAASEQAAMDQRWNDWKAKSRRENVAFREKFRVVMVAAAVAALVGVTALWILAS